MIDRKLILYVLAGVIAFALWEAWQKDYGTRGAPEKIKHEMLAPSPLPLPSIGAETSKATAAAVLHETAVPEARLLTVRTDVLDVAIDTAGGNIVRADLLQYPESLDDKKPVRLLSNDPVYYYITQSGIIGSGAPDTADGTAGIYSSSKKQYVLEQDQGSVVVALVWSGKDGVSITKTFTFTRGKYNVAVDYKIKNTSKDPWQGHFYAQIKRKEFGAKKGLFQFSTYTGASVSSKEKPYEKISFSDIADATKNKKEFIRDNQGGWVAMQQRYFLSVWVPSQDDTYRYFNNEHDGVYTIGLSGNTVVPAGGEASIDSTLYVGPEVAENLAPLASGLERTADYGWLWVISLGFFWILKNIYRVISNWGVAIILVTVLIKAVFYKLSESSCRSMAKMRELMPKIQALKERYADDKQSLHQATMDLYKRENINPLNLGGCLPMLIQIPFFIALYYVLIGAVELRQAPFIFWIKDLSVRDPYYVLPVLMGISMFLQQKLTPTSSDPAQAKMMMLMPVIFTFFFLNFPAGLVLYWFVSNVLSILQQWYINKKLACGSVICHRK